MLVDVNKLRDYNVLTTEKRSNTKGSIFIPGECITSSSYRVQWVEKTLKYSFLFTNNDTLLASGSKGNRNYWPKSK